MANWSPDRRAKYNAYMRDYNRKYPEKGKHSKLMREFGISLDEYYARLKEQDNKCKICLQHESAIDGKTGNVFSLAVDHCHTTKKVRGLLCMKCNRALGLLQDDVTVLQSAINYLKEAN